MLLLLAAPLALAQDPPESECRGGSFFTQAASLRAAQVTPGAPTPFFSDEGGCPIAASPRCEEEETVAAGAEIIAGRTWGVFVCVASSDGGWIGWLRAERLAASDARPADWAGRWVASGVMLEISAPDGLPAIRGMATWGVGERAHVGEIDGPLGVDPGGETLRYARDGCQLAIHRVGPRLVIADNKRCGGAGVSFDGVYVRG